MDSNTLKGLQQLNQVRLTQEETEDVMKFFADREAEMSVLNAINTVETERMVHVMPMVNVLREDVEIKDFSRDQLQEGAPETFDGYWVVPRLVE